MAVAHAKTVGRMHDQLTNFVKSVQDLWLTSVKTQDNRKNYIFKSAIVILGTSTLQT